MREEFISEAVVRIKEILEKKIVFVRVEDDTPLVSAGSLDSLNVVDLVVELEGAFGMAIGPEDMLNENFETPTALAELCLRKVHGDALGTGESVREDTAVRVSAVAEVEATRAASAA